MKNWLPTGLLFMIISTAFSQGKISGTITDGTGSLPGANIAVKGATQGASADFDGKFTLNTEKNSGELIISFLGYENRTVKFNFSNSSSVDLGTIILLSDSNQLDEIVISTGLIDVAKDRKTPVAVSTITASEIQKKLGSQEFPEILKSTPSVYASKAGGGFGDSRIVIRGFDQKNVAVMINGTPVNDMENSAVYWSNWAGLSDVTSAMQVQRGLGASKLAISSVGGTINIVTKTSDMKQGGVVSSSFGNNGYLKAQASYSTGVMENGLSASVLFSRTAGDGYVDGTEFEGYNYFIAVGYKINAKHSLEFTFTGAPQWHNQRSNSPLLSDFLKYGSNGNPNIKYNSDWGYLNGEEYSLKTNYYGKPVASLNWEFEIDPSTKLSTVIYGSWGRGGGTTTNGGIKGSNPYSSNDLLRDPNGLINLDLIQDWNSGQPTTLGTRTPIDGQYQNSSDTGFNRIAGVNVTNTTSGITQIASVNSHNWYGAVINLDKKLSDQFTLDFGIEGRMYEGIHFQNLINLFGATNYKNTADVNNNPGYFSTVYAPRPSGNPFINTDYQERINYWNDSKVNYYGAFSQLEYEVGNFTAFLQAAISQQGYQRMDYFKYEPSNPLYKTSFKNILGGDVKAGLNYNIDDHHNVFVNGGFYSKQPFFNAVYPNNASILNNNLTNEKISAIELGYGFRSGIFNGNLNAYYTTWDDRFTTNRDSDQTLNPGGYYTFSGVNETHTGIELDVTARPIANLKLNGMISLGNWKYDGNATSNRFDVENNPVAGGTDQILYLNGVKVGNAAQTTMALGASYQITRSFEVDANLNYSEKIFGNINPTNFDKEDNKGAMQLPGFATTDAGVSYKLNMGEKIGVLNFRLNVDNVFDKIFINETYTNIFADDIKPGTTPAITYEQAGEVYNGVATANKVYFGYGRTYNFTLRYEF